MSDWKVLEGDCREVLASLPAESVHAVVTDPPYSIEFMGREWDRHENEDAGMGYYLAGLIDGEGCFRVDGKARRCEFTMKMRDDDEWILQRARAFIGHGRVTRYSPKDAHPQATLVIDTKEGAAALCALLMRYPLRAKKLRDFLTWAEAVDEWLSMGRGNRWHGPADRSRLAELGQRLREGRTYSEVSWSGNGFQDWTRQWAREALRVLKPGGFLLCFGGTRTSHRLAAGLEDAGFEIRDTIAWMYGSGFPKSLDVAKAIDKAQGIDREDKFEGSFTRRAGPSGNRKCDDCGQWLVSSNPCRCPRPQDEAVSEDAARWQGWGTALKPSFEPIIVARKPFRGTVAENVLAHGTGALNIDAARVGWGADGDQSSARKAQGYTDAAKKALGGVVASENESGFSGEVVGTDSSSGRWPANVVLGHTPACRPAGTRRVRTSAITKEYERANQGGYAGPLPKTASTVDHADEDGMETVEAWDCHPECPVRLLDEQSGDNRGGSGPASGPTYSGPSKSGSMAGHFNGRGDLPPAFYGDTGGASRFFYCAKPSRAERNAGLEGMSSGEQNPGSFQAEGTEREQRNFHPTVKPVDLMRWLVRLVTPPGGTVLDPFAGSGTTGCATVVEGFDFIGVEADEQFVALANRRIEWWSQRPDQPTEKIVSAGKKDGELAVSGQMGLL